MGESFAAGIAGGSCLTQSGSDNAGDQSLFRPERAQGANETFELHLEDEVLQVQIHEGTIHVQQGQTLKADVVFRTNMAVFMGLFSGHLEPEAAICGGFIQVEGDAGSLSRFLSLSGGPSSRE